MSGAHNISHVTEPPSFSSTSFEKGCISRGKYSDNGSLIMNSPCSMEQKQSGNDKEKEGCHSMQLEIDKHVQLSRQSDVFSQIEKQDAQYTPIELKLSPPATGTYCHNNSLSSLFLQSPLKYKTEISAQSSEQEPQCLLSENSEYHLDVSTEVCKLEDITGDCK